MRLTLLTLTLAVTGVPALRVMPLSAGRRVFSRRTPAALSTASSSSASSFDIGVALHACGAASDLSQELCLTHRAAYVMAPCCIGKIRSSRRPGVTRRAKGGARSISARHAQQSQYEACMWIAR